MNYDEYITIASEIKELAELLKEIPEENILGRSGFEVRLKEKKEDIRRLQESKKELIKYWQYKDGEYQIIVNGYEQKIKDLVVYSVCGALCVIAYILCIWSIGNTSFMQSMGGILLFFSCVLVAIAIRIGLSTNNK